MLYFLENLPSDSVFICMFMKRCKNADRPLCNKPIKARNISVQVVVSEANNSSC